MSNSFSFDLDEARRFLKHLDPNAESFVFQTFPDKKSDLPHENSNLTRVIHGSFEHHAKQLVNLNKNGAGIFVTINKTDGKGRKASNVIALRSLFVDSDDGPIKGIRLTPSALVRTKKGEHLYYFLKEGIHTCLFRRAQKFLIWALKTDPSIKDVCRVMRLPGFFHMKDPSDPFLIRSVKLTEHRYSILDVYDAYLKEEQ